MTHLQEELQSEYNRDRRLAFWGSMRSWFEDRGYILYEEIYDDGWPTYHSTPTYPNLPKRTEFPYAHRSDNSDPPYRYWDDDRGNVICAQDSKGRHVAMKLVKDGSEEYRILRFLFRRSQEFPPTFDTYNHVIPVLDLIPIEDHWIVVMPRWGIQPYFPRFDTTQELLYFVNCLLKGLEFLHSNNIFHGDLSPGNILVNEFGCDSEIDQSISRCDLRSQGLLTYAIFDFNCSVMFPPNATREQCRLPYTASWRGTPGYTPRDTAQGEYDFDPFAWDIATLGISLCSLFQQYTVDAPMLAPLLDMMVTRNIKRRFTASEAVEFFGMMYSEMTEKQLSTRLSIINSPYTGYERYDRWKNLDPAFVKKWSHYREPPLPWGVRFMRWICGASTSRLHVVAFIRWVGSVVWRQVVFGRNICHRVLSLRV